MIDLSASGLNPTEANMYQTLLSEKDWRASDIAKIVGESRTNTYKILDKLAGLKLAEKFDKNKIIHYRAKHPSRLLELAQEHRNKQLEAEKTLELNSQTLLSEYIKIHEQPGVRYFQGKESIATIFESIAQSKTEVQFIHTTMGQDFYGYEAMNKLRLLAPRAGVRRRALTPDSPKSQIDYKETDPLVLLQRTWLDGDEYTAPVEWGVFDNTLYIISYAQEAVALTIESQQITQAFRQIFKIIENGQKRRKDYATLPRQAQQISKPYAT